MAHTSGRRRPPREHGDSGGRQAAPALAGGERFRFAPSALPSRVPHLLQKWPQGHRPPQAGGLPFRVRDAGPGCRQVRATGGRQRPHSGLTARQSSGDAHGGRRWVRQPDGPEHRVAPTELRGSRGTSSYGRGGGGRGPDTDAVGSPDPEDPPCFCLDSTSGWRPRSRAGGAWEPGTGRPHSLKAGHPQTAEAARGHEGTGEAALKLTAGPPHTSPQWFQQPGVAASA